MLSFKQASFDIYNKAIVNIRLHPRCAIPPPPSRPIGCIACLVLNVFPLIRQRATDRNADCCVNTVDEKYYGYKFGELWSSNS